MTTEYPLLTLSSWQESRDTVHAYARVLGKLRQSLTPFQQHWWHVSLRVTASGLTTTPIPAPNAVFELGLDWLRHQAIFTTSTGEQETFLLSGQSPRRLLDWLITQAEGFGAKPEIDREGFSDAGGNYDEQAINRYHQAMVQIDQVMKSFSGSLDQHTGPVQLFPHHLDLAVTWFSERSVPGQDASDPETSREQMTFGFSTGDASIPDPYIYATAYPLPEALSSIPMPPGAYWNTVGFQGAVFPYAELTRAKNGRARLYTFLTGLQSAGAELMLA